MFPDVVYDDYDVKKPLKRAGAFMFSGRRGPSGLSFYPNM